MCNTERHCLRAVGLPHFTYSANYMLVAYFIKIATFKNKNEVGLSQIILKTKIIST